MLRKCYEAFNLPKRKKGLNIISIKNLKDGTPSGLMTTAIRLKMCRIIRNFIAILKMAPCDENGYLLNIPTFITLTLSAKQLHTDKELNRLLLNEFIINIQRRFGVKNYVWRSEKQENGNLHYHIIIDKYIFHTEIRKIWNDLQQKTGYIEKYRMEQKAYHINGFKINYELLPKWSAERQEKAYNEGCKINWSNPNSTDIHSLKNIINVESYVTKYMSKDKENGIIREIEQKRNSGKISEAEYLSLKQCFKEDRIKNKINARIWGCSDAIKGLKDPTIIYDANCDSLLKDMVDSSDVTVKQNENVCMFYAKNILIFLNKYPAIINELKRIRRKIYFDLYLADNLKYLVKKKRSDNSPGIKEILKPPAPCVQTVLF